MLTKRQGAFSPEALLTETTLTPDPLRFLFQIRSKSSATPLTLSSSANGSIHNPDSIVKTSIYWTACLQEQVYCQRERQLDLAEGACTVQVFQVKNRIWSEQSAALFLWRNCEGRSSCQTKPYKATERWRLMVKPTTCRPQLCQRESAECN